MNRSFSEGVRDAFDRASDMDRAMSVDTVAHHGKQYPFGVPQPALPIVAFLRVLWRDCPAANCLSVLITLSAPMTAPGLPLPSLPFLPGAFMFSRSSWHL